MTLEDEASFGTWLRAALKRRRLSQRQLAERSGVDHSTISRILTGEHSPRLATATKLAQALGEAFEPRRMPGDKSPAARVEHALRAGGGLTEAEVHRVMTLYLALRKDGRARSQPLASTLTAVLVRH